MQKYFFIYIAIILSLSSSSHSMESQESPADIVKAQLLILSQEATQRFGYNPNIRLPKDLIVNKHALIFLHGFGGDGDSIHSYLPSNLHLTYITFDFEDKDGKLLKTSLGQLPEVLVAAYTLFHCHQMGFKKISLFGVSRGGNVALNLLRLLADPLYKSACKSVGIKSKKRSTLLNALKRGVIILQVPLTNTRSTISKAVPLLPEKLVTLVFSMLSHHALDGMQGIDSAHWLCTHKHLFNSAWYMAAYDKVISNGDLMACAEEFRKANPKQTYYCYGYGDHTAHANEKFLNKITQLLMQENNSKKRKNIGLKSKNS